MSPQVLDRVQLRRVRGKDEHRQSVARVDQIAHHVGDVRVQPVPYQHDQRVDQVVHPVDQRDVVLLGAGCVARPFARCAAAAGGTAGSGNDIAHM